MTSAPAAPFGRVLTAMVTAFNADGTVDLDGTARIAAAPRRPRQRRRRRLAARRASRRPRRTEEDGALLAAVSRRVGDRATVVAGVGTNDTAHSVELAEQAEKIGADGLLLVTPYYSKPAQAGVLHHFRAVAAGDRPAGDALRHPRPHRHQIADDTYRRRSRRTTVVVAIKDAVGDLDRGV